MAGEAWGEGYIGDMGDSGWGCPDRKTTDVEDDIDLAVEAKKGVVYTEAELAANKAKEAANNAKDEIEYDEERALAYASSITPVQTYEEREAEKAANAKDDADALAVYEAAKLDPQKNIDKVLARLGVDVKAIKNKAEKTNKHDYAKLVQLEAEEAASIAKQAAIDAREAALLHDKAKKASRAAGFKAVRAEIFAADKAREAAEAKADRRLKQ
jgi:hypothetical protein